MTDKAEVRQDLMGSGVDAKANPDRSGTGGQPGRPEPAPVDQRLQESGLSPNELDQTDESQKAADITRGNTREP